MELKKSNPITHVPFLEFQENLENPDRRVAPKHKNFDCISKKIRLGKSVPREPTRASGLKKVMSLYRKSVSVYDNPDKYGLQQVTSGLQEVRSGLHQFRSALQQIRSGLQQVRSGLRQLTSPDENVP